jgi:hypothetical protein
MLSRPPDDPGIVRRSKSATCQRGTGERGSFPIVRMALSSLLPYDMLTMLSGNKRKGR